MNIRHVVMTGSVWALLCATQAFAAPPKDKDVAADSAAKNAIKADEGDETPIGDGNK